MASPLSLLSIGTGIAGSIGKLFGGGYDPSETALARYKELTDFSSPYWKQVARFYQRSLSDTAPSIDTLTQFASSQGIEGGASLAIQQSNANQARVRDTASRSLLQQMMQSEQLAQGYLGQGMAGSQGRSDSQLSFLDSLIKYGGGTLARDTYSDPYANQSRSRPADDYQYIDPNKPWMGGY